MAARRGLPREGQKSKIKNILSLMALALARFRERVSGEERNLFLGFEDGLVVLALLSTFYPEHSLLHIESLDSSGVSSRGSVSELAAESVRRALSSTGARWVYLYARPRPWILFRNSQGSGEGKRVRGVESLCFFWERVLKAAGCRVSLFGREELMRGEASLLVGDFPIGMLRLEDDPISRAQDNLREVGASPALENVFEVLAGSRDMAEGRIVLAEIQGERMPETPEEFGSLALERKHSKIAEVLSILESRGVGSRASVESLSRELAGVCRTEEIPKRSVRVEPERAEVHRLGRIKRGKSSDY
jgi:hypothetical protein